MSRKTVSRKCDYTSKPGVRCLRKALEDSTKCILHSSKSTPQVDINKECAICLEGEDMFSLTCQHQFHLGCLRKTNKLTCPMCRAPMINLPDDVKQAIEQNSRDYQKEQLEENERDVMRMIQTSPIFRIPPQMEILLAMRYLYQIGISPSRIPSQIDLEIDPESPLPSPGSIFQTTVARLINAIKEQLNSGQTPEEDDTPNDTDPDYDSDDEIDEDDPFYLEGDDLGISHAIRTMPFSNPRSLQAALESPMLFSTMRFILSELDLDLDSILNQESMESDSD